MTYFADTGAHIIVDGSFGSTGKGVLAAYLAAEAVGDGVDFHAVVSNAGPNSGHTFYHNGEKHVLKQLPTFAVKSHLMGRTVPVYLSAGAIINPHILRSECRRYPEIPVIVHPNAAIITQEEMQAEKEGSIAAIASTGSGTGAALANKIHRRPDAVARSLERYHSKWWYENCSVATMPLSPFKHRLFVEVSQGFSLGINQRFYPHCTSRECTVMQAISDACIPPRAVERTYMTSRTYPIRVGNTDKGHSGDWYSDQQETTWEELGQEPETTTVTGRIRRVASFSEWQFVDACRANDPDFVFVNFMNYLPDDPAEQGFFKAYLRKLRDKMCYKKFEFLWGYGPESSDVKIDH